MIVFKSLFCHASAGPAPVPQQAGPLQRMSMGGCLPVSTAPMPKAVYRPPARRAEVSTCMVLDILCRALCLIPSYEHCTYFT